MNIIEVIKFIRKSKDQHFISVDKEIWNRWSLLIKIAVWSNKNYVPCVIYRKKYKFLENIVVVGLKWNGKNVKRRTSGFAKEFLKDNKSAKCIYCEKKLNPEKELTSHTNNKLKIILKATVNPEITAGIFVLCAA